MRQLLLAVALCGGCGGGASSAGTAAAACAAQNACGLGFGSVSNCSSGVANISDPMLTRGQNGSVSKSTVECVANAGSNCGNVRKCFNDGSSPQPCSVPGQTLQCN